MVYSPMQRVRAKSLSTSAMRARKNEFRMDLILIYMNKKEDCGLLKAKVGDNNLSRALMRLALTEDDNQSE